MVCLQVVAVEEMCHNDALQLCDKSNLHDSGHIWVLSLAVVVLSKLALPHLTSLNVLHV
jgi:hypothetical protein